MLRRREFLGGMGALALRLLFRRRGAAADAALVDDPEVADQAPSAIEITAYPRRGFRPDRLFVSALVAHLFVIEDITIGDRAQLAAGDAVPATVFSTSSEYNPALSLDAAAPGAEIKFRVRYVGDHPAGAPFYASLVGVTTDGKRAILPVSSECAVVA